MRFCCAGCLAVSQTIRAAGLAGFYAMRERPGGAPPPADTHRHPEDDAAGYPSERIDATRRDVALLLDGMHCGACVWLLESWLRRQAGIEDASVNFATRRARVRFATLTGAGEIVRAVAKLGYRAYPYDPGRRERLIRAESRALLLRTALALFGMMQTMMFAIPAYITLDGVDAAHRALLDWASLVLAAPVVAYSGAPFFVGAWRDLRVRRLGMDVPIALGIAIAFAASVIATVTGEGAVYFDSVTMFIALVLLARLAELRVRERAGDAVEAIALDLPQTAERLPGYPRAGIHERVAAGHLEAGDFVRIAAGGPVPADGEIVEGRSSVEEAIVTGESWPRAKGPGERVLAGSLNRESPLIVRVTAAGPATTLAALSRLVERAASERPRLARLSNRIAGVFVACLLAIAAASALAWSLVDPARALPVAIAVLVVSCPCALSLAIPAALAATAGALSRQRILCVRADALESLSRVTHVVLDKTGTLTTGAVRLLRIDSLRGDAPQACLALAAALEAGSAHPIAAALRLHAAPAVAARDIVAVPGQGVEGTVDGKRYRLGRPAWVDEICATPCPGGAATDGATLVALADEAGPLARLQFGDALRDSAARLVASLRGAGLRVSLVSGDGPAAVARVAAAVGIDDWRAEVSPEDKRAFVAALQRRGAIVAMIGDGVNDAPSLACADVSLTLGSAAALTQWSADVVVLGDDLGGVAFALRAARRAFRVIRQNLGWALAYNAFAIPLAASGELSPVAAAIGMSASSLIVVGNAWRLARPGASAAERSGAHARQPRAASAAC